MTWTAQSPHTGIRGFAGVQVNRSVLLAQLLVRHGRGDEATERLRSLADSPGGEDWIVDMLCIHYADQGRAEDGLAYLDALKVRRGEGEGDFFRMQLRETGW